jgi:hypothetical protein
MSGRARAFGLNDLDSDGDSSSEDFHQSSYSETDEAPPQFNIAHSHYDGSDDDEEEESMDYEGRDTIQPDNEFMPPTPTIHRSFPQAQNLQNFKNQLALLDMVDEHNHPESSLFIAKDFLEGEEEEIFDEDEQMQNLQPQEDSRDESVVEDGGAIEVDEPFLPSIVQKPFAVLTKPLKLGPLEEIPLEGFPQGHQFHKSFRAGWSPNGSLVIPRCVHYANEKGQDMKAETNPSLVTTSKIQVFNNTHTTSARFTDHLVNNQDFSNEIYLLEKHLAFAQKKSTREPNGLTYFTVAEPDELISVNRKGNPSSVTKKYHYDSEIWYLVEMLWGTPSDIFANDPPSSYSHQLYRRNAVGRWFSDTTAASASAAILNLPNDLSDEEKECATIFQFLTTKKVSEAVDVALQSKDFRFAALVSQAASNNALFKKNIETQVVQWKNMKALQAINKYRQYVYHILSGEIEGGAKEVDWKRGLALYFWYGRDVSMEYDKIDNLQLALRLYEDAFKKNNARPPFPNYLLNSVHDGQNKDEAPVYDTSYHLLQLFCHPASYPIRTVLQPKSYDNHPLNYHLSWHLHKILRTVIKDNVMDVQGPEQWNLLDYEISMNYAFQLESVGQWEWALYVILNIDSPCENLKETFIQLIPQTSDSSPRQHSHYPPNVGSTSLVEDAFKQILSRHVPDFIDRPAKRNFLTQALLIPESWIKAAEATYQHYKKNYEAELNLLLESEQWEAAHNVLMKHLLYELLLHENSHELNRILETLCLHRTQLQEWPNKGGLFLEYLKLNEKCKIFYSSNNNNQHQDLLRELNNAMKKIQVWNSNNSCSSENNLLREACIGEMSSVIHNHIVAISKKLSINGFNVGHIELQALPNDLIKHHLDVSLTQFLQKRI